MLSEEHPEDEEESLQKMTELQGNDEMRPILDPDACLGWYASFCKALGAQTVVTGAQAGWQQHRQSIISQTA
ncbi:hypothetical protein TREES_T100009751 [Tupaia chinensis]|uniref:Uncharacterized protein n=1 Tax=Tupaia chinensis TaxID=246437 RepID=L9KX69_TUPCH|nr:hypothetical protein TREES_T100009751 [Tupaia chinensis]